MGKVTDAMVWQAQDAGEAEISCWRVFEWASSKEAMAVRDNMLMSSDGTSAQNQSIDIERHEFKDKAMAQRYIHWRAMKVSLESVMTHQAGMSNR